MLFTQFIDADARKAESGTMNHWYMRAEFILADADCVVAYEADAVHKVHMMLMRGAWLRMKLMHEKQRVVHESSGALVRRTSQSLSLSLNTFN